MPELPEVERMRGILAQHCAGQEIQDVTVIDSGVLRNSVPAEFIEAVTGATLAEPRRRGKWLIAPADGFAILFHFGMTGQLCWSATRGRRERYDRVIFQFAEGELRYRDQWKLRGIWLARTPAGLDGLLGRLGPDALTITVNQLFASLGARHRRLKAGLMDQTVVAGLGNMLVDEILWRARLHPWSDTAALAEGDWERLYGSLQAVLGQAVPMGYVPQDPSWLPGNRQRGGLCPRCGGVLCRGRLNARTTYWCPRCQPATRRSLQSGKGEDSARSSLRNREAASPGAFEPAQLGGPEPGAREGPRLRK